MSTLDAKTLYKYAYRYSRWAAQNGRSPHGAHRMLPENAHWVASRAIKSYEDNQEWDNYWSMTLAERLALWRAQGRRRYPAALAAGRLAQSGRLPYLAWGLGKADSLAWVGEVRRGTRGM